MKHAWQVHGQHVWSAVILAGITLFLPSLPSSANGQTAHASTKNAPLTTTATSNCNKAQFRVTIDVGHSAEVPGALSARGIGEYWFNLSLAKVIEQKLLDAGFSKTTLLITPGKAIAGLLGRINYSSKKPADLFLSIHHDAVPNSFLQKWTYEGKEHFYCDRFKGHSLFISHDNVDYNASLQFARLLGLQLKSRDLQYTPHYIEKFMGIRQRQLVDSEAGVYRFDNLVVLRSTNSPAVLFEAGSIINRDEEIVMQTPAHQEQLASAVTAAVERFCHLQNGRKPDLRIARRPAAEERRPAPIHEHQAE